MYSLYRAWLSLGPCNSLPPLPPIPGGSLAPHTLNLSPQPALNGAPDVSLQVGPNMVHFSAHRSVLSAHSGYFKAALTNQAAPSAPIMVPNINIDEFSSLLTFMYTGYLDLNLSNIYNILLATHILHMPKALEICRNFLLQTQPMENRTPTNIIKPIPSRKTMLPTQPIYTPMFSNLTKSESTPFRSLKTSEPIASTSKQHDEIKIENTKKENKKRDSSKTHSKSKKTSQNATTNDNNNKTIVDIACCDGPVRFYRVINKNYGLPDISESSLPREEIDKNTAINKVLSENIRDKQIGDENNSQNASNDVFTCLYCNHTFKSQYCYQKHARRHLNPVSIEAKPKLEGQRREVRLLDMNVQYYPCKTCGSKFPSYYFVHKHRKMCHAEEMADSTNKNNEISAVNSQNLNISSQISSVECQASNAQKFEVNASPQSLQFDAQISTSSQMLNTNSQMSNIDAQKLNTVNMLKADVDMSTNNLKNSNTDLQLTNNNLNLSNINVQMSNSSAKVSNMDVELSNVNKNLSQTSSHVTKNKQISKIIHNEQMTSKMVHNEKTIQKEQVPVKKFKNEQISIKNFQNETCPIKINENVQVANQNEIKSCNSNRNSEPIIKTTTNHGIKDIMEKQYHSNLSALNIIQPNTNTNCNYIHEDSEDSSAIDVEIEVAS